MHVCMKTYKYAGLVRDERMYRWRKEGLKGEGGGGEEK